MLSGLCGVAGPVHIVKFRSCVSSSSLRCLALPCAVVCAVLCAVLLSGCAGVRWGGQLGGGVEP